MHGPHATPGKTPASAVTHGILLDFGSELGARRVLLTQWSTGEKLHLCSQYCSLLKV